MRMNIKMFGKTSSGKECSAIASIYIDDNLSDSELKDIFDKEITAAAEKALWSDGDRDLAKGEQISLEGFEAI